MWGEGGYGPSGTSGLYWAPGAPSQHPTGALLLRWGGGESLWMDCQCVVFKSFLELISFTLQALSLIANVDGGFHIIKSGRFFLIHIYIYRK